MLAFSASLSLPDYFRADFTQTVAGDDNRSLRYEGRLLLRSADENAKWIYTRPIPKTICVQSGRVWVIEPELEQVTLFRLRQSIPLAELIKKAKPDGEGGYSARYADTDYRLEADESGRPVTIAYTDEMGHRITIRFHDIRTDPIPADSLRCDPPEDYDIVDGRF